MYPDHKDDLASLKRIEGQVRGIQRMVLERKYCVDILTQLRAVMFALARVEDRILERHFKGCVKNAAYGVSKRDKDKKLQEILSLIRKFRKL